MKILKVSSKSEVKSVAGAIAGAIREQGCVELQAVGASAVNQVVKAIIVTRSYLAPIGTELMCVPAFLTVTIDGSERTAVKLIVVATSLHEVKTQTEKKF